MFYSHYLKKRSVPFRNWKFQPINKPEYFSSIIIIPSYSESQYIIKTLISINNQINYDLTKLLVIVVVNNALDDSAEIIENNIESIELINNFDPLYTLRCIDAATDLYALPIKFSGVGYSRKIGMDFALKYSESNTIFHCLDADTIISSRYLEKINNIYIQKRK